MALVPYALQYRGRSRVVKHMHQYQYVKQYRKDNIQFDHCFHLVHGSLLSLNLGFPGPLIRSFL